MTAKKFDGKAAQFFGYLPRARFAIKPVPDDMAPFYTAGRGGPGVYLVNTYDLPSRPLYNLPALTLHESAPGHAFQIPIAILNGRDLPGEVDLLEGQEAFEGLSNSRSARGDLVIRQPLPGSGRIRLGLVIPGLAVVTGCDTKNVREPIWSVILTLR